MNIDKKLTLILLVALLLYGCAAAIIVPVVGTAAIINEDRRTAGTFVEDQNIEMKAIGGLFADKEIKDSSHINVTSHGRIILITGETPTEELRQRIIEIIRNIPQVSHVYDELTIAGPSSLASRSSDTLITAKVKIKLLKMPDFGGLRVKVVTENGVVYLMGMVTKNEGEIATNYTRQTAGVQKVVQLFQYID